MDLQVLFSLESNPIDITFFTSNVAYVCNLCNQKTHSGVLIVYSKACEIVLCLHCYGFLKEGVKTIFDESEVAQLMLIEKGVKV